MVYIWDHFQQISFVLLMMLLFVAASPDCDQPQYCGNLEIPYPFSTKEECYLNDIFLITCNRTHYNPPKAFIGNGNVDVTNISINNGELHISLFVAKDCYSGNGSQSGSHNVVTLDTPLFTISNTKNKFIAIGCDTKALISGKIEDELYEGGCMALCGNSNKTIRDGHCAGNGCCELEIPEGLKYLKLEVNSFKNHTEVFEFNPCGYGFVIKQDQFHFSSKYISNYARREVPLVLDWAIPNGTCSKSNNKTDCNNICGQNTQKISFVNDYRCQCLHGFTGNPYLPQGCQDVNECDDKMLNECEYKHLCINTPGRYTCRCPKNYKVDGRSNGKGCIPTYKAFVKYIVGCTVGLTVLVIGCTLLCLSYAKWKANHEKNKFFKRNGGLVLEEHLSKWESPVEMFKIFTHEELKKGTNKFHESAVVGKGGFGTVYKGVLEDGLIVAIKKSKLVDQSQTDQFINEVIVLSQINHRNVVKLLGCCLETKVPLLVYEFVTNGTLFEHIHNKTKHAPLSWEIRLKIASEIASVLAYLHSSTSTPIIHRDIKSSNVLLDHDYTAKLSDFGASKLVPLDHTRLSTMVQGTLGYLDPEYLLTSELTEKSDVYSFGILLFELITGKKAVRFDVPEEERILAKIVLCAMNEDHFEEIVEEGLATEATIEEIKKVAKLAKECVKVKGEERPTMKEVAMELEGLQMLHD
ncbi:hypothetical protein IC575_005660 [Cucumis melo]|uniref:Wall-associated receptor kinase-like 16 n=1 Tax=Cucumis melo TaxID=3656 RepID=A0A1S3B4E7_CUCME|nr:putative wall-associated receptor kinase-like 16 [Cucumis melo]